MPMPKVALLVNFVAPYRAPVYSHLASMFDLTILTGAIEGNRGSWKELNIEGARVRRVVGWQLSLTKRDHGKAFDHWFLHLEPGYVTELIRERPDAVISAEMGFRTLVALTYGWCFGKPAWVWWGGTSHTERNVGKLRKLLRRLVACWAKHWISYGQTSTDYLLTLGIPRERILQIGNCVDESWYNTNAAPALNIWPKPVLLYVGQLIARKGIPGFLRAAARLQREGLKFSIVLVGDGREGDEMRRLGEELGLENTRFYPAQPPTEMPAFYRGADVLIFPTMEDVWGLVANEAVLSGLPVLCSRYAGCAPELFDPECIFDPADEEQFVSALRRAVVGQLPRTDPSRLRRSSEVGDMIANAVLASARPASIGLRADRKVK